MIRKMLRTIGSLPASILLNLSIVAPSIALVGRIDAPRACARGRQIEAGETVKRRQRAGVDDRMEALRKMPDEIGKGHFAGEDESDGPGAEPDDQQRAADQFDEAG